MTKRFEWENCLTKLPFLGYIFRKIQKNRKAILIALQTDKKTEGEVEKRDYLFGLIKIISYKTFDTLKLKKRGGE